MSAHNSLEIALHGVLVEDGAKSLEGGQPIVIVSFVQLRRVESECRSRPFIVAALALGPAGETPDLPPLSAGRAGIGNIEHLFRTGGVQQHGIGLLRLAILPATVAP